MTTSPLLEALVNRINGDRLPAYARVGAEKIDIRADQVTGIRVNYTSHSEYVDYGYDEARTSVNPTTIDVRLVMSWGGEIEIPDSGVEMLMEATFAAALGVTPASMTD